MYKYFLRIKNYFTALLFINFLSIIIALSAVAGSRPEIIKHNANFLGSSVNFNIQWQSFYPVTAVKVSVAGVNQTVEVDEFDNRRNQDGYWGEVTLDINLPQNIYYDGRSLAYVVELEDDLRQKSEQLRGHVIVVSQIGKDHDWGGHLGSTGLPQGSSFPVAVNAPVPGSQDITIVSQPTDSQQVEQFPTTTTTGTFPPPQNVDGVTIINNPTIIDNSQNVNVMIEVVPTGLARQRMFAITVNDNNAPGEIRWHVIDREGRRICEPRDIMPNQDNVFWTEPISLEFGSYKVIAQPLTGNEPAAETSIEFIIDEVTDGI